jgi:hypothetical protein
VNGILKLWLFCEIASPEKGVAIVPISAILQFIGESSYLLEEFRNAELVQEGVISQYLSQRLFNEEEPGGFRSVVLEVGGWNQVVNDHIFSLPVYTEDAHRHSHLINIDWLAGVKARELLQGLQQMEHFRPTAASELFKNGCHSLVHVS